MSMKSLITAHCLIFLFTFSINVQSQENFKRRPSPLALTSMRFKDAYVKVTYSQPQKNEREVFGKLVPYDQVWRTGANEATEITVTKDILVNNLVLKAGTYSFFTIPGKEKWTIIFNTDLGLWGSYNYNTKLDVLRIEAPVQASDTIFEAFTMQFDQRNEVADLLMMWDTIKVIVPFKFIN
jgi:hypothetical protein